MTALIAFDTSTERTHIGLTLGKQLWLHEGDGGAQASTFLIPSVMRLLSEAGIAMCELDAVAFGRGPGAFTGLRTACSVAQGFAFGAGKPVLAIDTLMAVAQDAHQHVGASNVWVTVDARMDEVYAAHYKHIGGVWQTVVMPALYTLGDLHAHWDNQAPLCVAGSALPVFGQRLRIGVADAVEAAVPSAAALLVLAQTQWQRGELLDAQHALPVYVRNKVALTTQERDAIKASQ